MKLNKVCENPSRSITQNIYSDEIDNSADCLEEGSKQWLDGGKNSLMEVGPKEYLNGGRVQGIAQWRWGPRYSSVEVGSKV